MSHFEGNLRPVNKIRGTGHEQAEDESEYKEDLGAMASPSYAHLVYRRRLISCLHRAPPASGNPLITLNINKLHSKTSR